MSSSGYLRTKNYKETSNAVVSIADRAFNGVKETVAAKSWRPLVVIGSGFPLLSLRSRSPSLTGNSI